MRKQLKSLAGLLSLWVVVAGSSRAQVRQGVELGLYGGINSARGGETRVIDQRRRREIRTTIDDGIIAGLRAAYNFNRHLALELSTGGATNNYVVRLFDEGDDVSVEDTNAIFFLHGNTVLHLARGRFVPFVTAGGGGVAFVDQLAPAANYGGGLKIFITERVSLRLDVRQHHAWLRDTIEQVVPVMRGSLVELFEVPEPYRDKFRFREATVGISFSFGRK